MSHNRRHPLPFRIYLWIITGAFAGIAAGTAVIHLTKHLFHKTVSSEHEILIQAVSVCIAISLCTVAGHLFHDRAKSDRQDAAMRYETAPTGKRILKEALILLMLNGGAAALMWVLLQAEE